MKNLLRFTLVLMIAVTVLYPSSLRAFNSATHIFIADHVFPYTLDKANLFYGAMAPDLAMYVDPPGNWSTSFGDTHYNYIKLPYLWWHPTQKAFAKGWQIHNEIWGADHFAHGTYPAYDGYVIKKAESLAVLFPILRDPPDYELAHFAVEVAIDLLLIENDDHLLGQKLLAAALLRSQGDLDLLAKTFVASGRTNWNTLSATESAFRQLLINYGIALTLPDNLRMAALGDMGVQVAYNFGVIITSAEVQTILEEAIYICKNDYKGPIEQAIIKIKNHPGLIW